MPLTKYFWENFSGYDVHVLRNGQTSPALDQFVIFEIDTGSKILYKRLAEILADPSLLPEFETLLFLPGWTTISQIPENNIDSSNNIDFNVLTGEITANPVLLNGPAISSFIIEVHLYVRKPDGDIGPFSIKPLILFVHVHNNIEKAWVTPATLNVRPDIVKGISSLRLKAISGNPIEKINWFKDLEYSDLIDADLLIDSNPFDLSPVPQNHIFILEAVNLFENRKYFPANEVFPIPMHLEILYVGDNDVTRLTIPTHLWHLNKPGHKIKDEMGNDLFEIVEVIEKFQYKASVYASFDDGTTGDITNWHGITWSPGPGVSPNDVSFDAAGAFQVFDVAVGKTLPITATLPAPLASVAVSVATGNLKVNLSWLNSNPVARPVPGSPTHLSPDETPNVLFVAEGFRDEAKFRRLTQSLCAKLKEDKRTTPWDYLFKNAINTWMLFERSEEEAASVLYENVAFEDIEVEDGHRADIALPLLNLLILGPAANEHLEFLKLIFRVGLPIPADSNKTLDQKLDEWRQLFDPNFGSGNLSISEDAFNYWKKLANRRLAEERNTTFGLCCGEKPTLKPRSNSGIVSYNRQARLDYNHINLLLSRVRANSSTGDLIGEKYWGRDQTGNLGKDFGLVIFLIGGLKKCGARTTSLYYPHDYLNTGIAAGMDDSHVPLSFLSDKLKQTHPFIKWKNSPNPPAIEIIPFEPSEDISISSYGLIAHELGHFFNLEDEYPVAGSIKEAPQDHDLSKVYNLQLRKDVLENGKISGNKIKWRWPRIKKAGVLADDLIPPAPQNKIEVTLKPGQAAVFAVNEVVHLRQKDILQFQLESQKSPKLTVIKIDDNKITLEPLSQDQYDWSVFKKGSLVVLLVTASSREEENPYGDEYAELLSPMIRKKVNDSQKPLTKEPCIEDDKDTQEPVNIPSMLSDPDNRKSIIGLYSGGLGYSCNIYHPAGECIMRRQVAQLTILNTDQYGFTSVEKGRLVYPFCQVCRYSLVDQIDPTQHRKIDDLYEPMYPRTSFFSRHPVLLKIIIGVLSIGVIIGIGYLMKKPKKED